MYSFDYHKPASLSDAAALLGKAGHVGRGRGDARQVPGHAQQGRNGQDPGAADAGDKDVHRVGQRGHLRLG